MKDQQAIQELLISRYEAARLRNPQLSRRAFSRRLGISPGAAGELFNGQRQVSRNIAERIATKLALDPQERAELFALFPEPGRRRRPSHQDATSPEYLQLSADHFRLIGDWYHFAILTLMRTKGFKGNPKWIARRLGISPGVAKAAVERLKRLELVREDRKGVWTRSKTRYRTTDDIANVSINRAHSQYLEKANEALNQLGVEARDFTSLMLSLSPEQLPRAKEMIREFQDRLALELEAAPGREVYRLLIQLFPLTQNEGDEK